MAYQITAANTGPSAASTVSVTDTLPAGVTFVTVSASNGGWSCSNAGNASVTCNRATWASALDHVHHQRHGAEPSRHHDQQCNGVVGHS